MTGALLVIDDNEVDREQVRRLLKGTMEVREAATIREGLEACNVAVPDCVLLDYRLPDGNGVDVIAPLIAQGVAVVMLSGQGNEQVAVLAMKNGAHDYVPKDRLSREALERSIRHAIAARDLRLRLDTQQAELERSESRLRLLLGQLPCLVWTTDLDGRVTSSAGNLEDFPAALSSLAAAHRETVTASATRRASFDHLGRTFQAELQPLHDHEGRATGVVGVAVDVTDRKRLEEQLRHSQKMEAIGRLAGGVAHDFNNLLTIICGFTEFAVEGLPEGHAVRADLQEVLKAAERSAELTGQLLAVARRRPAEPVAIAAGERLQGMLKMIGRLLGADVQISTHVADDLWQVRIDPSGFEQILLNLSVNARDAMPTGGRLTVELQNCTVDMPISDARGETAEPGRYVRLVVTDTGVGMNAEVRERLFEPFFTTKKLGEGTGLGLATLHGIVRQAGGLVQVYSEVGHGTAFRILLPAQAGAAARPVAQAESVDVTGTETVLIVEDDAQIQVMARRALEHAGYHVHVVGQGEAALTWLDAHPEGANLVLTDVVTPGMDVSELLRALHKRDPNQRVALTTGYSPRALGRSDGVRDLPLLEKPFSPQGLQAFVRHVLDTKLS